MAIELKVPSAGESITEVTLVEWVKKEGDYVEVDETIAVIETDKANVELVAPVSGTITKTTKAEGDAAEVGEIVGYMEAGEKSADAPAAKAEPEAAAPAKVEAPKAETPKVEAPKAAAPKAAPVSPVASEAQLPASPSVRQAMRERRIDPSSLKGSGPGGRIEHGDLHRPAQAMPVGGSRDVERVKMTRMRKRIAERLVRSQHEAAMLTTFNEVDMAPIMELRKQYKEVYAARHGVKLGFMSFFVKAVIEGLKEYPALNAYIEGEEIVYHDYYDIGVAVGGGRGLVVPVLRNAERMSFSQIEKAIGDFGRRARDNALKIEELEGGTFTVSNGGVYGSMLSTPIINPPQSGILGMHNIVERPVVKNGQIVATPMMYLALSYDHRIVDGREAVSALVRMKEVLENPTRLLLEI